MLALRWGWAGERGVFESLRSHTKGGEEPWRSRNGFVKRRADKRATVEVLGGVNTFCFVNCGAQNSLLPGKPRQFRIPLKLRSCNKAVWLESSSTPMWEVQV